MNRYIHNKKDKTNLINSYLWALVPLILFSFYKNGLLLYFNKLINFKDVFIPLYFYIIAFVISILISFICKDNYKENILYSFIITSTISINTNIKMFILVLFSSLFIVNYLFKKAKFKINRGAIVHLLLLLALLANKYSYLNIAEKLNKFNYNMFDIFLGHNVGGIATTSLILSIVAIIIMSFNPYYKKRISISSSITFVIVLLAFFVIKHDLVYLNLLCSGNAYFVFAFLASDLYTTPNNYKGMSIYGIIIGLLSAFLTVKWGYEMPYLVVAILSFFIPLFNKIYLQKN